MRGSAGEENEEEDGKQLKKLKKQTNVYNHREKKSTLSLLKYRNASRLLHVITIKLISCYILFKYLHVSFKASIPYPF